MIEIDWLWILKIVKMIFNKIEILKMILNKILKYLENLAREFVRCLFFGRFFGVKVPKSQINVGGSF